MNARMICGGVILLIGFGGCTNQNNPAPGQGAAAPTQQAAAKSQSPTTAPAADDSSAETLARKASSYAQQMQQIMDRHRTASQADSASTEPPHLSQERPANERVPSAVKWSDPELFGSRGSGPDQAIATGAKPTDAQLPTASVASLTSNGSQFPRMFPEGHDGPEVKKNLAPPLATDLLQQKLEQHVRDYPKDAVGQLDLQLLQFVQERPVPDMGALATLGTEDRDLLVIVLDGLSNLRATLRSDSNMLASKKVRPILEMSDRIRSHADLTIPCVALCKAVKGYGIYDTLDPEKIPAGRPSQAIVYSEIANFTSEIDAKQMWETHLTQEVALYTEADGIRAYHKAPEPILDVCKNRRHDFYAFSKVQFPAQLSIGRYVLKVSVVDQQSNRVAEATLPVVVVAP